MPPPPPTSTPPPHLDPPPDCPPLPIAPPSTPPLESPPLGAFGPLLLGGGRVQKRGDVPPVRRVYCFCYQFVVHPRVHFTTRHHGKYASIGRVPILHVP